MAKSKVFCDFIEYWHYAKYLSDDQRKIVFNSLSQDEQKSIEISYQRGGWDDVFRRNFIDDLLDQFKKKYKVDLLSIKAKVLRGSSVYMSRDSWENVNKELSKHDERHTNYCIGGIMAEVCQENESVVLILPIKKTSVNGKKEK